MKRPRYSTTRQKTCYHCATAKAKCDRRAEGCTRCTSRKLPCAYPQARAPADICQDPDGNYGLDVMSSAAAARDDDVGLDRTSPGGLDARGSSTESPPSSGSAKTSQGHEYLDLRNFSASRLMCPINAEDISNRWLHPYVPLPGQQPKNYPSNITTFIFRILKSYVAIIKRSRGAPPFMHPSQIMPALATRPLVSCLQLIPMCDSPSPEDQMGSIGVLQDEMNSLYGQHRMYDGVSLLGAFQAYLIYALALFYQDVKTTKTFLRQAMMNLQDLACSSSRQGLVCIVEQQGECPSWEAWVIAEAKRRTLYTMYLFDSVLSARDGSPTFLGTELCGLPAPAGKSLWRASTRDAWEASYVSTMADWDGGFLQINELWPAPPDMDDAGVARRQRRVELWLEDADDFGTMMYAVTCVTHGM